MQNQLKTLDKIFLSLELRPFEDAANFGHPRQEMFIIKHLFSSSFVFFFMNYLMSFPDQMRPVTRN